MADIALNRSAFLLEHDQATAAANGTNNYLVDPTTHTGIVCKVEFSRAGGNDFVDVTLYIRWTLEDGSILAHERVLTNSFISGTSAGISESTSSTATGPNFHATGVGTDGMPSGAVSVRVDIGAVTGTPGSVSVWVGGR